MNVEFEPEIEWDGQFLSRWAIVEGKRTQVRVPREMINGLPMYNDAIEREIQRDKEDIFERLKPSILVDLSCNKK
jgi:hypothetical protein